MSDFFEPKTLDVLEQVKRATEMGKIATENKRLGTVCKSIGVSLENAHDALGDITATRDLGVTLQRMGVPLIM
jgi:DNA polymerase-3 subunit epsilon